MVKRCLIWALVIFFAGMLTGFLPKLIHQVRLENAFNEYLKTLSENNDFRSRYRVELDQILMSLEKNLSRAEEMKISKRLSKIGEEIKAAQEKLARARKKFCDLAGEEELLCQEEKAPPFHGWTI